MDVSCYTLFGKVRKVPVEDISFRPAVYGLIIKKGKILLLSNRQTGKYILPGGGIEIGEHIEEALIREVFEETGLTVSVGDLLTVEDYFFYYDPGNEAYHCLALIYTCNSFFGDLQSDAGVDAGDASPPRWASTTELTANQFQPHFESVYYRIKEYAGKQRNQENHS